MNKCLVTKLNGIVNNYELLKIGEMRFKFVKVDNPTSLTQKISIGVYKTASLEIIGDGNLTDSTLNGNYGKSTTLNIGINEIYVSNNDIEVAISDKYSLNLFTSDYAKNISLDISLFKYSFNLSLISVSSPLVTGDIENLKELKKLTKINLLGTNISGDIKNLKELKKLAIVNMLGKSLFGNIGELSDLNNLREISFKFAKITGDIATIPSSCRFISLYGNDVNSVITWSTRSPSSKILAIEGTVYLSNVDKMLQDQAQCEIGFNASDGAWYKKISCSGTRTSASDAAVATLQQKGYTVSITPA